VCSVVSFKHSMFAYFMQEIIIPYLLGWI
jgi:hypothetical protein